MPTRGHDSTKDPAAQKGVDAGRAAFDREKPAERTAGLKLFDAFLYPGITNVGVFAISVVATYLTSKGGARNAQGELRYGKLGEFFQKRGDVLMDWLKAKGLTHDQADMAKMVAFSFADGSLLAPVVKVFEDHREDIAKSIDNTLGTRPENDEAYKAEPKQTWGSVLGGRFATAAVVVPTAVALDKAGLNKILFSDPGKKMGEWIAKQPELAKKFGSLDIPELGKISAFEAFYTSVCTASLYVTSRLFARWGEDKSEPAHETNAETKTGTPRDLSSAPKPFMPIAARLPEPEPKPDEPKPKDSKPIVIESPADKPSVKVDANHLSHESARVHSDASQQVSA